MIPNQLSYRVCHLPHTPALIVLPTGYFGFDNARNHSWQGAIASGLTHFPPDLGPSQVDPSKGVITIGAVPWIINFNVPVVTGDMAAARRIARAVSERGGGLKGVEVRREKGVVNQGARQECWSQFGSGCSETGTSSRSPEMPVMWNGRQAGGLSAKLR